MSCSVNVQQIIGPLNTLVIERQQDAGDPGSITTTNIIITNDFLQQIEVIDICRGIQGPSGPPGPEGPTGPSGLPGITFDVLPIESGGTNNTSFNADYIIYYDGSNDQLASTNYTIDDIIAGAQALTGIVAGSGVQKTDLGNNQTRIDAIVGDGLDVHRTTNAIFVDDTIARLDDLTPGQFQGILPVSKGGTSNTVFADGKLITFDSSALNGSGQFISASNIDVDDIVVSGNGFTLTAGSGLVNGGFVIIPNGTGRIDIPESADITVFADSFELSQTGVAGTYSKVTTDSKGRVESGGQLTPQDLYNILGYIPWHSGNDGCGSELDADLLCGQSGDYYLNATNITGIINTGVLPDIMIDGRYTKVDVNAKGLVTSGMQMTPEDIEIILGYDPVSPTGGVDFCGDIELHGSLFINKPTGCEGATSGLLRVYDNLPLVARNNSDILPVEPRGVSFVYGGGFTPQTGSIAYYPTEDVVYVTTQMQANQNGVNGGDSDDDFTDDINGGDASSTFPISNLTGTQRLLLYKDTADELYVSRTEDQIVAGIKNFVNGIQVKDQVVIYNDGTPSIPPTNVGNNTLLNVNFNADLLDGQHGEYYLDANNITGVFDPNNVSFGFIQGTKNYIPKFAGNNVPANRIDDSVMFEDVNRDVVVGSDKNLVVGPEDTNNIASSDSNILVGENNNLSQTNSSLVIGDGHFAKNVDNVLLAGYKASGLENNSIAHGRYGTAWLENQIAHGAYRVDNDNDILQEHGQASDYMMYLEGQIATNWATLSTPIQLPDDTTLAFKVSLLMNSAFSTGVAEFEFYSGIVKNVRLRNPDDISQTLSYTTIMQQPQKNTIYNNSHIHNYYLQLLCTNLNEIQNETIKVADPPIETNTITIDNEPTEIISSYQDPDGYNATYLKDNLGNLAITIDPVSLTGNYIGVNGGDLRVSCDDHGLLVGEYAYIEFTSHNQVSLPDDRYLVKAVIDANTVILQGLQFQAEKQTDNSKTVLTILPDDIRRVDSENTVTLTGVTLFNAYNYYVNDNNPANLDRLLKLVGPDSHLDITINNDPVGGKHYCLYRGFESPSLIEVSTADSSGISWPRDISYKDYTYEFIRKADRVTVSGIATDVQWLNNNTNSLAKYVEGGDNAYTAITVNGDSYLSPITDNIEVIGPATTGMDLYLDANLSIDDGTVVNVSVSHTGVKGSLKLRQRQRQAGSYERIQYDPNKKIDCVYTLYPSEDPTLPARVHIYAEDYEDLGFLDNPYEFILYDDNITPTDNDKFKIVAENDVYHLYTATTMPMSNTFYTIEVRSINVYGETDIDKLLSVYVSELASSANNEKGLDNIVLTNNTVPTGAPADTYVGTLSGIGGYNPLVVFDQGYNTVDATFVSGSDVVSCTGTTAVFDTVELIGDPCVFCTGAEVLADYSSFSVSDRTLTIEEVYCETGILATPIFGEDFTTRFIWSDPSSIGRLYSSQIFDLSGIEYTVTNTGIDGGFEASKSITQSEEEETLKPNITWIEYTGIPSELYAWPSNDVNYETDLFFPSGAISGLEKNVGSVTLDFESPLTGLVLWFKNISAAISQDGYITQEDSFKIATEDNAGFLKNDSDYSNSGLLVADRPFTVLSPSLNKVADNVLPFLGSSVDLIVCMTGQVSGQVDFSLLADAGSNYQIAIGQLSQFSIDSSVNPILKLNEVYEDTLDDMGGKIIYTGMPLESGNHIVSGIKQGPVFRSCQNNENDGIFGYETQTDGLCYITGKCEVYSASVGPDGEGEAVYRITFPEDIYISYEDESYIQLSNWTATDINPGGDELIVPSDGHYPITEVSGITNNTFLIPEQYAIALPVEGTGLSAYGTVSGSFDIYHRYKEQPNNIINQIPGDFLTVERAYNPSIDGSQYIPKNDLFDILSIQGDKIISEDKKNYVLIEDGRPPYLDHTIRGVYVNDSREFYANSKAYGNRLVDLRFVKDDVINPDNTLRNLPYADGPWAYKDLYVSADYDHVNKRLVLFNLPTGVYRPLDRVQISFQDTETIQYTGKCSEPQYFEFPADHMYVYTGLPVTEFNSDDVGEIQFTLADQPPEGWVKLDGSIYDIRIYPQLKQYLDYYRLRYADSPNICWTAATLPDFRNANTIGSGVAPWDNLGDIVNSTGFIPISGDEPDSYYDPPVDIVGFWIMKAKGSFYDPSIPINLGDSGSINYIIDNFDLGRNTCDSFTEVSFSTTSCRVRLDILQFLEPDLRFNVEFGVDEIYQVSGINHDINYPCLDQPIGNMTGLYTPTNAVKVKPRSYTRSPAVYSVVVDPADEILNVETDSGVLGLYTREEIAATPRQRWGWWPLASYVMSETGDEGPLSTPCQLMSGTWQQQTGPTGYATQHSPITWKDSNPNGSYFYFRNDSYDDAQIFVAVSGDSDDQNDSTTVRINTYDRDRVENSNSCFDVKATSENSDGYIVSDGNSSGLAFNVPSFGEIELIFSRSNCPNTVFAALGGEVEFTVYGVPYTGSQGKSYIVSPDTNNSNVAGDFNIHATGTFDLQVYQLPSLNMSSNFCGVNDRVDLKWFSHPHKMYINNFNTPRSYLEYGDEFKIIKLNNNTVFGNNVTNLLTKINPTSEDASISGLSTSDQHCRYIPCQGLTDDPLYNSWRYPIIWGVSEATSGADFPFSESYTSLGSSRVVSDFPGNGIVPTKWETYGDGDYTITINNGLIVMTLDQANPTGFIDVNMGGSQPYFFVVTTLPFPNPDQNTATWTVSNPNPNMPKPWTDPLVAFSTFAYNKWIDTTYGFIKNDSEKIHYLPAEWCNTGQYEDRYRSIKPVANNLATQVPFTGTCEFSQSISGRMYIPENNNLYFHTYGETTAYWPLDENGSGIPHQQTGVYIIGTDTSSSTLNSCGSGLICIDISGFNGVDITGIPTVGDRDNIGSNPIVIESNGVTGIVGNYGANKQFYFDFDDGLPQLSKVYNVIDYLDGQKQIVISAPVTSNMLNKSGLVFMIDNPKNIKSHLNPNLDNEFIVSDPNVTSKDFNGNQSDIFTTQINHFDDCTKRWKHLLHFDWDVIGTGYQEININTGGESADIDLFPLSPTGIQISGIRFTKTLTDPFQDIPFDSISQKLTLDVTDETDTFYLQVVTLYGQPAFTEDIYQDLPKVTISGIQNIEYNLNVVDDISNYHGSGWNVGIMVNRTNEIIDDREIVFRAEDATGKADEQVLFNQRFLPKIIQSYTGYALPTQNNWRIIYDTRNLDLTNIANGVLEFSMQGVYDSNPSSITYTKSPINDNVLIVEGIVDPAVNSLTYYNNAIIIATTGFANIEVARTTGTLVDLKEDADWTPLELTLNNFNSFGDRTTSGNFYLNPALNPSEGDIITFDIPAPQPVQLGVPTLSITHMNQAAVSPDMGYLISHSYSNSERRFNVNMVPTGADGNYYTGILGYFPNNQLDIEVTYYAYDASNQQMTPNPTVRQLPLFNTTLYTGLLVSNSNPETIQYYTTDEPWSIQVKVSGGITDHNPNTPPNVRIFNAPNEGNYEKPKEPVDCIISYQFQNDPGNTCWLVQANARRDIFGKYMPNETGVFHLYVNVDDNLTDYTTLNDSTNQNDQFTIIYNKPSGFINLPPIIHSVPSAPFFTKCDVLGSTGLVPTIVKTNQSDPGFNLIDECSPGIKYDEDFSIWQQGYRGTTISYEWDAKVEIDQNGIISASVKGLGKDKVMAVAKVELLEIESDQLVDVPFRIKEVTPAEEESEQFGQMGIIVEQGKAWEMQVTTEGGLADPRYPPTIVLTGMPTFCTGYNPMDGEANDDLACIIEEPSFSEGTWQFKFSGEPSCDLLGIKPFGILAIDTLTGIPPSYLATDVHQGQFIYETGEFSVLPPEISFTGETELSPFCDICYTGIMDFGPQLQEDLDCNAVTGIKTITVTGELPAGLDYTIWMPDTTFGPPVYKGQGDPQPDGSRVLLLPAPWNNLASGYIAITGCPTEFAPEGGDYLEEFYVEVCNAVDDCVDYTVTFQDASEAFDPNPDFAYFFSHTGMVLSPKSGLSIVGVGNAEGVRAPNAQLYNMTCQSILPENNCKLYHVFYSGLGAGNGSLLSGLYPENTPSSDKIDLPFNPNNFIYYQNFDNPVYDDRYAATEPDAQYTAIGWELLVPELTSASSTGTGLIMVEGTLQGGAFLTVDRLDEYFPVPFEDYTTKCLLGNGNVRAGTIQGEFTKIGLRGQLIPRWSGYLAGDSDVFASDDEYMSGVTLLEINTDLNVPYENVLVAQDCWQTGNMRMSGVIPPYIQVEITDPPPAANTNYSFLGQDFSFFCKLAYGTTVTQRTALDNNRGGVLLNYEIVDMTQGNVLRPEGSVSSSSPFTYVPSSTSGIVYAIHIYNEADDFPTNVAQSKNYSFADYTWIHKGAPPYSKPTITSFPPIFPTGFGSEVLVTQNTTIGLDGIAYGGYVVPDNNARVEMVKPANSVPPDPFWQTAGSDWSSSNYLPSISGMVLSSFEQRNAVLETSATITDANPDTIKIPVTDDYVAVNTPLNVKIYGFSEQILLDYSFIVQNSNLLGSSPVTGVEFDCPINGGSWQYNSLQEDVEVRTDIIIVSGIIQSNGFDSSAILFHDLMYNIGDIVVIDSPSGTSSTPSACEGYNVTIVDGDTSSMLVSGVTNQESWSSVISPLDVITLYKQEAGEIYVDPNSISAASTQGNYDYTIAGNATSLYKDYTFRIVTCENPQIPPAVHPTEGDPAFAKNSSTDYPLRVSKPISVHSYTKTGSRNDWIIRLTLEGGQRPIANNTPRVTLVYGNSNLGTLCGFDRYVVGIREDNVLIDEYDPQTDRLTVELRANSDYDWTNTSTVVVVISDETGEVTQTVVLPT